jgi:hypothetical protein
MVLGVILRGLPGKGAAGKEAKKAASAVERKRALLPK